MDRKSIQNLIENRIRTEKKKYENTTIDWIKLAAAKAGSNIYENILLEKGDFVYTGAPEGPLFGGSDFDKDDESTLQIS